MGEFLKHQFARLNSAYRNRPYYDQKKAQYTALFMFMLTLYMIPSLITDAIFLGFSPVQLIGGAAYYLVIVILFIFFKKGKILLVTNVLIIAGLAKAVEFFTCPDAFDFYIHISLSIIITITIYVRPWQVILSLSAFNILGFARVFMVNFHVNQGNLGRSAIGHSLHAFSGIVFFTITSYFIMGLLNKAIHKSEEFEDLAQTDPLTGLGNRRKLENNEGTCTDHCRIAAMLDLDHFKTVNDDFGHQKGDQVLQELTDILEDTLRGSDSAYRWGGEEFIVIISGLSIEDGILIAQRLRKTVQNHDFKIGRSLTISIGLSEGDPDFPLNQLIEQADKALYQAKREGRNRVIVYSHNNTAD